MEISAITGGGGIRYSMANAIKTFHIFEPFPKIQLQKKKWGKKWIKISANEGGGGILHLMTNAIKNFHIFLNLSLREAFKNY